jgi:DnaK suppressor protein
VTLKKTFLKKIKVNLLEQKELSLKPVEKVSIDLDGDEVDEIQGKQLIELNRQLAERKIFKIRQIDEALNRIEKGSFGICQDCEEEIPEKRLEANPYVMMCVDCAEDREKTNKRL